MLTLRVRLVIGLASLMLIALFYFPLWRVSLNNPKPQQVEQQAVVQFD